MNKAKWIKKIIGEAVTEKGFSYTGCTGGSDVGYSFKRRVDGEDEDDEIMQIIEIFISLSVIGGYDIRLTFCTNAYGVINQEVTNLIPSGFKKGDLDDFLHFENEEELKQILQHFRRIIVEKGEDVFREISKHSTEARPKKKTYRKLYEEHEELNQKYRKLYGMEDTEFTAKLMRRMNQVILEIQDEDFADVEETLIGLAAVYGDQLVRKCGGEWELSEVGTCMITGIHEGSRAGENPLNSIIFHWRNKRDDYRELLDCFRKHPYDTVI
jgi:hypothetical protein